jgi:hypothetical protein
MTLLTRSPADPPPHMSGSDLHDVEIDLRDDAPSLFSRPNSLHERRSLHPIDQLGRELDDVCSTAVDPLEIAAILEAQGTSDAKSSDLYNLHTVFELAEELFRRVPARKEDPTAATDVQRRGSARDLSHGVLFALNALFFAVALQVASSTGTTRALVGALVLSWASGQSASLMWFRVEGRQGPEAGRTLMRRALMLTLAFALVVGPIVTYLELPAVITVLAIGQIVLVMAASVLVLYGREVQFFLALLPAGVAAAIHAAGFPIISYETLLYFVVGSIMLTVVLAAWQVRPIDKGPHHTHIIWDDVQGALQIALYGVIASLLLSFNALSSLFGAHHDAVGFDLTVLPLVITIGVAEWQLRSTRYRSKQIMTITDDLTRFGVITWRLFLQGFIRYWAVLILASVVLWSGLVAFQQEIKTESVVLLMGYAVLGGAFFLCLMLIACVRLTTVLRCLLLASVVYLLFVLLPTWNGDPVLRAYAYLVMCAGLLIILLFAARSVVRQALVHL